MIHKISTALFPNIGAAIHVLLLVAIFVFYIVECSPTTMGGKVAGALFLTTFAAPIPVAGYLLFRCKNRRMKCLAWEYTIPALFFTARFYSLAPEAAASDAQGALIYLLPAIDVGISTAACVIIMEILFLALTLLRGSRESKNAIIRDLQKVFPNAGARCCLGLLVFEYFLMSFMLSGYSMKRMADSLTMCLFSLPFDALPLLIAWFLFCHNGSTTRRIGWEILITFAIVCTTLQTLQSSADGWFQEDSSTFAIVMANFALYPCGFVVIVCETIHHFLCKRRKKEESL